jgi:hypothetical protein
MLAGPFAVEMSGEDVLDPLPRDFVNEYLVSTRIVDSLVLGQPLVVRVDQDLVQVTVGDWLGRQPWRRCRRQTTPGEMFS